ncbi:MAG: 1-acyl-sn-glycerol-3-phosphate acyltransferase [Porticoccaceae bacterium]
MNARHPDNGNGQSANRTPAIAAQPVRLPISQMTVSGTGSPTADVHRFEDIRPYRDDEVRSVLDRLVADRELIDTLLGMKFSRLAPWLHWLVRPLMRRAIRREFAAIHTVADFQTLIGLHLGNLLRRVATAVTVSGLDRLKPGRGYLLISNHRDIAMDPAIISLVLHNRGMDTARIAIGDNLLTKPFTSDLMRLNKSFIVKRSVSGRRAKLDELKKLSAYIRRSIIDENCSVWIAQREGRAKDSVDHTETALLKMLALSRAEGQNFAAAMSDLRIVPVAISYEFDPCDGDKARELYARRTQGAYQKQEHEDLASIYTGIVGAKGNIHVAFGEEIGLAPVDDGQLATAIDRQIIDNYHLQPTHIMAWEILYGRNDQVEAWKKALVVRDWQKNEADFGERLAAIPEEQREIFLEIYANPVSSRLALLA